MQAAGPSVDHVGGASWLHRANPVVKLAWLVGVIAFALATYHPVPLFVASAGGYAACVSAGIGRPVARTLVLFAPIAASMLVIQTLLPVACVTPCTTTLGFGPLGLSASGMTHGLSLAGRILVVEVVALGVLTTTRPSDLFAAFARLRVPYLLNFMLSMTLQLVPILQREFTTVFAAQRSRGMRGRGFGSVIPTFVPVFAGAFERVQQLSISLESRAFGSSRRATSFRRTGFGPVDAVLAMLGLIAGAAGAAAGLVLWNAERTAGTVLQPVVMVGLFVVAAVVFLAVIAGGVRTILRA